jgi:peptidoglycan/xylan/chitin deacetylase (PgdA/CDA1 family)
MLMLRRIYYGVENLIGRALLRDRCSRFVRESNARRIPILAYHSVSSGAPDRDSCFTLVNLTKSVSDFRREMALVARHYTTITFSDLVCCCRNEKKLPVAPILLTFDDGFQDVYVNAVPVLEEFHLKATFFIIGDTLDSGNAPWLHSIYEIFDSEPLERITSALTKALPRVGWTDFRSKRMLLNRVRGFFFDDELDRRSRRDMLTELRRELGYSADTRSKQYMDSATVRNLLAKGFEVGCHSMYHEYLSRLSDIELACDIDRSFDVISEACGREPKAFCYPFGNGASWNTRVVRNLAAKGYETACSTLPGMNAPRADLLKLRRIDVSSELPLHTFSFRVHGIDALLKNSARKMMHWRKTNDD